MKKKILFLIVILAIIPVSSIWAQETDKKPDHKFHLGLYSGLGISGATSDSGSYEGPEFSFNPGIRFSYFNNKDFGFMAIADVGYLKVHYTTRPAALTYSTNQIREFVNINLMGGIKYKFLYATGGFYFAPLVSAWRWDDYNTVNMNSSYSNDFGLVIEGGAKIPMGNFTFFLGLNARYGLADINNNSTTTSLWTLYGVIGVTHAIF
ncbi:MAG: hypothetical protein GY754_04770 [bacterium]|nr:hypothetical protein [bacterium]